MLKASKPPDIPTKGISFEVLNEFVCCNVEKFEPEQVNSTIETET